MDFVIRAAAKRGWFTLYNYRKFRETKMTYNVYTNNSKTKMTYNAQNEKAQNENAQNENDLQCIHTQFQPTIKVLIFIDGL